MKRAYRHRPATAAHENQQPFFTPAMRSPLPMQPAPFFQAKGLKVGAAGDRYEREADAMANAVIHRSAAAPVVQQQDISTIQRESLATPLEDEKLSTAEQRMEEDKLVQEKPELQMMEEEEEEPTVQIKGEAGAGTTRSSLTHTIESTAGRGRPLSVPTQAEMQSAFGVNFSSVNIHTDATSVQINRQLRAQAFTHGRDIYFNEGKYRPETSEGKHLLAHELTHVVQQTDTKDKQLRMDRDDSASPQSGLNEEQVACPDSDRLDEIEQNYRSMITAARERGYPVAADNLEHFLAGSGSKRILEVDWLRGFSEVTNAEKTNQGRFESSLENLADGMAHGERKTLNDYWDAMLTASVFTELYYASGTSTITSTGSFSLERIEDIVNISGTVEHKWHDPYDWHAGLGAFIPGHGNVSDEDGLLMQSCRGARPFEMEALWTQRLSGSVNINDYWFNSSSFSWTGP